MSEGRKVCRLSVATMALAALLGAAEVAAELTFQHVVVDATNPANPHCKTLGDIDGDGQLDAVAASSSGGGMFWYEHPGWTQHTIRASGSWTTDMQAGDIDGDGDLDLAAANRCPVIANRVYENGRRHPFTAAAGAGIHPGAAALRVAGLRPVAEGAVVAVAVHRTRAGEYTGDRGERRERLTR